MNSFTKKKTIVKEEKKEYKFEFHFKMKQGEINYYSQTEATKEEAEQKRKTIIKAFTQAIMHNSIELIDGNLIIRGDDLSLFWVGDEIREIKKR